MSIQHEFYQDRIYPASSHRGSTCGVEFTHQGVSRRCGQLESHEWHHIAHCTACKDRGFYHQDWGPGGVKALPCPVCEEGELMKEFLL